MLFTKNKISKYIPPLFILGFTTNITQVIVLREILNVFYNNELIIGAVLAFWMALTGLGAWIGRTSSKSSKNNFAAKFLILAILPLLIVFSIYLFKYLFFLPGEIISFLKIIPFLILILIPYCLLSGNLFSSITKLYGSEKPDDSAGKLYSIESAGSIAGGLVVGLVMVLWLNTIQSIVINSVIVLLMILVAYTKFRNSLKIIFSIICIATIYIFFINNFDISLKKLLFKNQNVLKTKETPYGNLTFTESAGQISVFENQQLLFFSDNIVDIEEAVHYAMLQRQDPSKVLLIGGGIAGLIKQVLKYSSVSSLIYVEANPWLIKHSSEYFRLLVDKRLKVIQKDARKFLKNDTSDYDIIIVSVPSPSSLQINRYYTIEFLMEIKKHCNSNSIVSFSIASSGNYMSEENRMLHSVFYNTLKYVFENVTIIKGEKDYFIASENKVSSEIAKLYDSNNVQNDYVNSGFIDDRTMSERSRTLQNQMISDVALNKDYYPVLTNLESSLFFSRFKANGIYFSLLIALILIIPLFFIKRNVIVMYVTGFTASGMEMIILIMFQIMFGFLYAAAGVLFATFMAGLAFGSWKGVPKFKNSSVILQVTMLILVLLIPFTLILANNFNINTITYPLYFVSAFAVAMITGMQYSFFANQSSSNKVAGYIYGVDLLGSALGILLVSVVFLPVVGLFRTLVIIGVLNIFAIIAKLFFGRKNIH